MNGERSQISPWYSEDACLPWMPTPQLCVSASVAVFWLASFSVSADRRAPSRQGHLALWAAWEHSLDQPLVCEPFSGNAIHKTIKARERVVLDVAFVQPESK